MAVDYDFAFENEIEDVDFEYLNPYFDEIRVLVEERINAEILVEAVLSIQEEDKDRLREAEKI